MEKKSEKGLPVDSLFQDILSFRPRTQETRLAQLLTAAIDLLGEKGIDEVTFESVGKRAKMARSHVVYYFKNREELVESAIRFVAHTAQRHIAADLIELGQSDDLLENYFQANFRWATRHPKHTAVMTLLYYESCFKKSRRKFHTEIREVGRKRIDAILRLDPRLASVSPAKRECLSRNLQALLSGSILLLFSTDRGDPKVILKETLEAARSLITATI